MTDRVTKLYKSALKNEQFLREIKSVDNDDKPKWYDHQFTKHLFAGVYYGWLVGKFGDDWESKMSEIK